MLKQLEGRELEVFNQVLSGQINSVGELSGLGAKMLRLITPRMVEAARVLGIDAVVESVARIKSAELVEKISVLQQQIESVRSGYATKKFLELVVEPAVEPAVEDEYQGYKEKIDTIAQSYYEKLKAYTLELCVQKCLFLPTFFEIVSPFKSEIENEFGTNAYSVSNAVSLVLKGIEVFATAEANQFPGDILLQQYQAFYKSIKSLMSEYSKAKRVEGQKRLNARQQSTIDIEVSSLLLWSKSRLQNLPRLGKDWTEVAIALMCLTGRRQSEIMCSGNFEFVDNNWVEFSGQLKKHSLESVQSYRIPVLMGAAREVVEGLKWLSDSRKRVQIIDNDVSTAVKKSHDMYSRYLSASVKDILGAYVKTSDSWVHAGKDRKKCHLLRQIYGQVVYPVFFKDSKQKISQVLNMVMGHNDSLEAGRNSSICYDADVVVIDIEKCQ